MNSSGNEGGKVTEKKGYTIVSFVKEKRRGKILIELVPNSWLVHEKDDKWLCYFPPKQVDASAFIEQGKPPASQWQLFAVKHIKSADTFDQGMRRLERAYKEADVVSTEVDSNTEDQKSKHAEDDLSSDDVCSSTSSPRKTKKLINSQRKADTVDTSQIFCDSDSSTTTIHHTTGLGNGNKGIKRKRSSEPDMERVNHSSEIVSFRQLIKRMDESDEKRENSYRRLSKQIKGAKQSILYDLNKKIDAVINTVVLNRGPGSGNTLKKHKEALGMKLPIDKYDCFVEFDTIVKENEDKETALKEIMANTIRTSTEVKDAVRKILGGLILKAVQECYSGTGRKGPNGVTKNNFSGTHVYACMKDVIKEKIEVDEKQILTATSRYLSGAGDREGGKAERDAKKKT